MALFLIAQIIIIINSNFKLNLRKNIKFFAKNSFKRFRFGEQIKS